MAEKTKKKMKWKGPKMNKMDGKVSEATVFTGCPDGSGAQGDCAHGYGADNNCTIGSGGTGGPGQ